MLRNILLASFASAVLGDWTDYSECQDIWPPPPEPEPIEIVELPLPPVSLNSSGSCNHATGCIGQTTGLQGGSFLGDGHVLAHVQFAGAPTAPDPASIYTGQQVIVIKTDGTFANGDAWKCITCGVPSNQSAVAGQLNTDWSYPQAFQDGKRILAGKYIISCDDSLISDECTPERTSVYPISLSGASFIRELRLHPDNVHIGINSFGLTSAGSLTENGYYGRLSFNASSSRYDIVDAYLLVDKDGYAPVYTDGDQIFINNSAINIGELRGFSGSGDEVTYIGYSVEACNIDVFAANLFTGKVRRLTSHPGYCDPIEFSPDDEWAVILDTRGSGRTEFMDGMRWLPPLTDLVTSLACSSVRNNGNRRFFQPWLIDRYGDRGDYYGQSLNNAERGEYGTGSIDDPQWNGQADAWFSPGSDKIVFWQAQAVSPACGGANPLPCYNSTEPGARDGRIMLATLTSRKPVPRKPVVSPSIIPWALPYVPGTPINTTFPRQGNYTLQGSVSGYAQVEIVENAAKTAVQAVFVHLFDYADEESGVINGYQNITAETRAITTTYLDWYANITRSGDEAAVQITSEDGFHMSIDVFTNIFNANGSLITEVEGTTYRQPLNAS